MKKAAGSALVLVILVIAGIIAAVFGTQRLALVQLNQAASDEDNLSAYYAAKAGIEDGLIRFRHNRNADTGVDGVSNKSLVQRVNLSSGNSARDPDAKATQGYVEIAEDTPITTTSGRTSYYDNDNNRVDVGWKMDPYRPTNQYYDLKLAYKTNQIGDFNNVNNLGGGKLEKDEYLELTGFPPVNTSISEYYLRFAFKFLCSDNRAFVQIQRLSAAPATEQFQAPRLINPATNQREPLVGNVYDSASNNANLLVFPVSGQPASAVRIRPYYCPINYAFSTERTADGADEPDGPKFDSLKTLITATGYYGRAKRTLIGEIDRKSGTLLGVYDFNLYAGGDVKP